VTLLFCCPTSASPFRTGSSFTSIFALPCNREQIQTAVFWLRVFTSTMKMEAICFC
jgi:hypothetical protein